MTRHQPILDLLEQAELVRFTGSVRSIGQHAIEADGPLCSVGEFCEIESSAGQPILAQVVAVASAGITLLPLASTDRVRIGGQVARSRAYSSRRCGDGFAGRAIGAFGEPIDGRGPITGEQYPEGVRTGPAKLDRIVVNDRISTGIRAIDGLVPIAKGQRIGIFAASGVGKTTLVEQMSARVDCDHCILCLIGERGREVERLWRLHADDTGAGRFTMVAATSDESATARVRAMDQALALAEDWRAKGRHVVLFVDSMTRLAMALREIGLAANEPPALRSYTPNVFAAMPHYVERCGADRQAGQITAIMTVLAETDDVDDPIVELLKSLLDGHITLSRRLAERNHYPAIDIGASVSRVADQVLSETALDAAQTLRRHFAEFEEARPMIESGIYRSGSNPAIDRAIMLNPRIGEFLRQDPRSRASLSETDSQMRRIAEAQA